MNPGHGDGLVESLELAERVALENTEGSQGKARSSFDFMTYSVLDDAMILPISSSAWN